MSHEICHLGPGEELMDWATFTDLHSIIELESRGRQKPRRARPARAPRPKPRRRPVRPPVVDIEDLCARALARDPAPPMAPPPEARPSPSAAAALEAEIAGCPSLDAVARLGVHLARSYASAAALFLVHRGAISGVASGGIESRETGVLLSTDVPCLFTKTATNGEPFRGAPPGTALDMRILGVLGREHVQEIALLPVTLRGRVVNILYADNGPQALGDAPAAALATVCTHLSRAYERLILERKLLLG